MVWAAVCFMSALKPENGAEVPCVLRVVRVSGTIRKCEEEAVRRARGLMGRAKALAEAEKGGVDIKSAVGLGPGALEGEAALEVPLADVEVDSDAD